MLSSAVISNEQNVTRECASPDTFYLKKKKKHRFESFSRLQRLVRRHPHLRLLIRNNSLWKSFSFVDKDQREYRHRSDYIVQNLSNESMEDIFPEHLLKFHPKFDNNRLTIRILIDENS